MYFPIEVYEITKEKANAPMPVNAAGMSATGWHHGSRKAAVEILCMQRFSEPVPAGGPFAREIRARLAASTHDRPDMWTLAHASKASPVGKRTRETRMVY